MNFKEAIDALVDNIMSMVSSLIDKAPFDKTYTGIVKSMQGKKITVTVDGVDHVIKSSTKCFVNDYVLVLVPRNNWYRAIIINNTGLDPVNLTNKLSYVSAFTPRDWGCKMYKRGGYYWMWFNITWATIPSGNVINIDDEYIIAISGSSTSTNVLNWNVLSNNGVRLQLLLRNGGVQVSGFTSSNFTANDGIREWIVFPDCLPTV